MKNWRAKPSIGGYFGIGLTLVTLAGFGLLLWLTLTAALETYEDNPTPGANLGTFGLALACVGLALVAVLLAYRTWRFYRLRYSLDRNAIKIELGDRQQVIPLSHIRYVVPADKLLDYLREETYGEEAARPDTLKRKDGGQAQTFSQPRRQTATAQRTEATTSAADGSLDDDAFFNNSTEIAAADAIEGEVVEAEFVEVSSAADGGSDFEPEQIETVSEDEPEPEPVTKKVNSVPNFVAFKVKTRPLTSWPGYYTNKGYLASIGPVQFYSTQPFAKTLLIHTEQTTYALSPANFKEFMTEFQLRRNLGAIEAVEEEVVPGKFLSHPLWRDWLGRGLIALGVLLNLALFAFIFWRFADLPPTIRLHYNKFGVVDRLEPAISILWLPVIGLIATLTNSTLGALLHPRERVPALLLYGSIIIVQLMVWIAAIGIIVISGAVG